MVIELSFRNSRKMRRKVQILIEYISIEEMLRENPKLLISLIESEREESEYLEKIKNLDR
nr:MAG TPA: hypothetical protein [Microviridae sp.]